jgi:hypothetical protein
VGCLQYLVPEKKATPQKKVPISKIFHTPPFGKRRKNFSRKDSFPCERDRKTNYKFDIGSNMRFIYRRIPSKIDFLG